MLLSLDIQSAYDWVWHAGLLEKLPTTGVPLGLVGWIGAFLWDQQATLRVGNSSVSNLDHGSAPRLPLISNPCLSFYR